MNQIIRIITLSACLSLPFTTHAQANPSSGSVMVLAKDNVEKESTAKNGGTQTVTIEITVNGKPKNPETRVIKWTAYGKDQKAGGIVAIDSGEIPVNLAAGSTQKTTTKKLTTKYKEKHTEASKSGGNNKNSNKKTTYKEVPGEGVKYYGYGVEVLDGGVVVGAKFDPRSLEKE